MNNKDDNKNNLNAMTVEIFSAAASHNGDYNERLDVIEKRYSKSLGADVVRSLISIARGGAKS